MTLTQLSTTHSPGRTLGLAVAHSSVLIGLEAHPIRIEVSSSRGPSGFQMVGLPEAATREARVRVTGALAVLGFLMNEYDITVNLAPAEIRKAGAALDVAIAVAVLAATKNLPTACLTDVLFLGELSLEAAIQPVRGVLPHLSRPELRQIREIIVPSGNAREAGLSQELNVRVAENLQDLVEHLRGGKKLSRAPRTQFSPSVAAAGEGDLRDVRGQASARRALELAAAGAHNLLFVGPPGSGKTLLARLLPTILPPLTFDEAIECSMIHSVAGLLPQDSGVLRVRPFRAPHHSVSEAGLVGGGEAPRPGEVSLAHHGVLFLDELAEFRRATLESLRQPLEDGRVCIARARARAWFPARPMVVSAVNPCPCGYFSHPRRKCSCSEELRRRYRAKLSGPLLDRLDIHVSVPPVEVAALTRAHVAECSADVQARVALARTRQLERAASLGLSARVNAVLSVAELERVAPLDRAGKKLLEAAVENLGLSARAFVKVLRVARTIADLEGDPRVQAPHIAEAIQGRLLDAQPSL